MQQTVLGFSVTIANRTRDFVGREWVFTEIDGWLADPDGPRYFIITGEPGIGETAIAARLAQFSDGAASTAASARLCGGFLSAIHFCSARNGGWISPTGFARSLSAQLAARYPAFAQAIASGLQIQVEQTVGTNLGSIIGAQISNYYAESPEAVFDDLVRQPLRALCQTGDVTGSLVILVDGLDESLSYSGHANIVRLLAACGDFPPQARFLITSRPIDAVLDRFRPFDPFILYARSEENQRDLRAYVRQRFEASETLRAAAGSQAQVKRTVDSLVERSSGNFLVISQVLNSIERDEMSLADPDALPAELQDLYAWFLDRLVRDNMRTWRKLYRPVMGTLAVAQEPVDVSVLSRWTGLSGEQVSDALHDLREFLDPALDGRCRLYHESVVDFLTGDQAGHYTIDTTEVHRRITTTYTRQFIEREEAWSNCDTYGLRHLAVHLFVSGQTETLQGLLFNFDWLQAKLDATDIAALLADSKHLPDDENVQLVQEAIRLAAHILAWDKTQLAGQLLGRLLSSKEHNIQVLLKRAREWQGASWLRPLMPTLMPPGGPLLRTLTGHTDGVDAVAVTADGRLAISASNDETLRVWDLERGEELGTFTGHSGSVTAVTMTAIGRVAISASWDSTLKVWDLERGEEVRTLTGHTGRVNAVAVTADGRLAISGASDGTLKVWDVGRGEELLSLAGHIGGVTAVAITPAGRRAISASFDHTLKIWDLESGRGICTLSGHTRSVNAVAMTADGRLAISASDDETLRVWDLERGEELRTLTGHSLGVNAVAVTADRKRAISASWDSTLKVWDLERGEEVRTLTGHTGGVHGVVATADGRRAVSCSWDSTLKVWDISTGTERREELHAQTGHSGRVWTVAVALDMRLAVSGADDSTLKVWDLERGEELRTLIGHSRGVTAVVVTPDGRRAISASGDSTLKVWELERGEELRTLVGHSKSVLAVTLTVDGRRVISASSDGTLKVWDLERGEELRTLTGHTASVFAVTVTPDGAQVVSGSDDKTVKVWNLATGRLMHSLKGHTRRVNAVAVTPDGAQIVSGSHDETVKVWDLERREELRTLTGHRYPVQAVTVTPDGRLVISASSDGTLRVWDLQRGDTIAMFNGDQGLNTCVVAPDGKTIVVGEVSGQVHFLRLEGLDNV
ncbi:MAG: hypothetical protein GY832_46795 [Chloroflexi bacterium]|nr:hypothetical protein [Chloroflexota bacterium]